MKKWFMQARTISQLEQRIDSLRRELEVRQAMIQNQNGEILKLQQQILILENDKKELIEIVKTEVKPIIHERQSKKREEK